MGATLTAGREATVGGPPAEAPERSQPRYVGLFWRLFIPNAIVLGTACVVLMVQPPNGRVPVLVGGLVVMLVVNVLLLRRAVQPLLELTELMGEVDPLTPGQRLTPSGPPSEVTVLAEAFNAMLDRLEAERSLAGRRALSELEAERRRIAAELHDQIGQTLTAVSLQVARLGDRSPEELRAETAAVREAVDGTIEDVRRLAKQLRPEALDALGLVPALTNLIERLIEQTGLRIERQLDRALPDVGRDGELVIYRVAQEAMTNAIRHAHAETIAVRLMARDGRVVLVVADDGHGMIEGERAGSGIRTMRERALSIGARLDVGPYDGGGTAVRLTVDAGGW